MIAILARGLVDRVVKVGNCSGRNNDKFKRFGLTPIPARKVRTPLINRTPLIKECFCNLEYHVAGSHMVKRYNLFILEVVQAWIDPAQKTLRPFITADTGPSPSTARS